MYIINTSLVCKGINLSNSIQHSNIAMYRNQEMIISFQIIHIKYLL